MRSGYFASTRSWVERELPPDLIPTREREGGAELPAERVGRNLEPRGTLQRKAHVAGVCVELVASGLRKRSAKDQVTAHALGLHPIADGLNQREVATDGLDLQRPCLQPLGGQVAADGAEAEHVTRSALRH